MTVTYNDIEDAQKCQSEVIRKTSLTFSETFSDMTGSKVYLKNEFEQKLARLRFVVHTTKSNR